MKYYIKPALIRTDHIILHTGTNNCLANSAAEVTAGVATLCDEITQDQPDAHTTMSELIARGIIFKIWSMYIIFGFCFVSRQRDLTYEYVHACDWVTQALTLFQDHCLTMISIACAMTCNWTINVLSFKNIANIHLVQCTGGNCF